MSYPMTQIEYLNSGHFWLVSLGYNKPAESNILRWFGRVFQHRGTQAAFWIQSHAVCYAEARVLNELLGTCAGLQLNISRLSALQEKSGCARWSGGDADGRSPEPRAGARAAAAAARPWQRARSRSSAGRCCRARWVSLSDQSWCVPRVAGLAGPLAAGPPPRAPCLQLEFVAGFNLERREAGTE